MEQRKTNTATAGVDVGKPWLDAAVDGGEAIRVANGAGGIGELIAWLKVREVGRAGLEATGGYERELRQALAAAGLEVVVHQPAEVRLFARLKRLRAKTDTLDARRIAAATAQVDTVRAAADPRLAELAERLTAYEQVVDQATELKTFLEQVRLKDLIATFKRQIAALERLKAKILADILARVRTQPDLLAPFDRQSGQSRGKSTIGGGRSRPRRMLYLAALAAKRFDPGFKAFATRLAAAGKPPKLILVAVMRKLIEAANLILARRQPWIKSQTE